MIAISQHGFVLYGVDTRLIAIAIMVLIEQGLLVNTCLTTPPSTRQQVDECLFECLVEDRIHNGVDSTGGVAQPTEDLK